MNTIQICKKCKQIKKLSDFYFYKSKNYRDGFCKKCRNENNRNWRINNSNGILFQRLRLIKENKNICHSCDKIKSLNAFNKNSHNKTGYFGTCKNCQSIMNKNTKLKNIYNINLEQFHLLLKKQQYRCIICNTQLKGTKDTCVDHNHINKKVRGLLCNNCNRAIGLFKDNVSILFSAAYYLKNSSV